MQVSAVSGMNVVKDDFPSISAVLQKAEMLFSTLKSHQGITDISYIRMVNAESVNFNAHSGRLFPRSDRTNRWFFIELQTLFLQIWDFRGFYFPKCVYFPVNAIEFLTCNPLCLSFEVECLHVNAWHGQVQSAVQLGNLITALAQTDNSCALCTRSEEICVS